MAAALIAISLFLALTGLIVWFGYRVYARPSRTFEQLAAPVSGLAATFSAPTLGAPSLSAGYQVRQWLQWVGDKLPQDPVSASITRRQLMAAGLRGESALAIFTAIRLLVTCFALAGAVLVTRLVIWHPLLEYGLWAVSALLGYMLTNFALDILVDRYKDILRVSLPDALDLLIVAVEAGLALDQALRKVSDELAVTHPEISKEFSLVSLETRTGVKRADALRNMADRTMEPEIRKFVAIMVQTDRFGTSIAESLRAHSEFMRVRRRQIAEEKANQLGVKLTIVVFFFILPAILIISGGPAFLRVFKELLPALRNMGRS